MANQESNSKKHAVVAASVMPWISIKSGGRALAFYKAAFGAEEVYHLDGPDNSVIARLSVDGAEFWVSDESPGTDDHRMAEENPIRMILTVADPDAYFEKAIKAGASEIYPVSEGHGWRIGRIADPFGHHWEIGKQIEE